VSETSPSEVTQVQEAVGQGDETASTRLMSLVYDELHKLASACMRHERPDHTLQATALVHEAYLRLVGESDVHWQSRAHFFGAAAEVMRRILVDHARARLAVRRGGDRARLPLDEMLDWTEQQPREVVSIDEALAALEAFDERKGKIVKLRFFGGLTTEEIAELLDVSVRTVKREWRYAKAWLYREIRHD